ncbi:hypothetical protein T07_1995 [Trichinella nelsoni]|uniref:Uncharacterized protein n=1 Tax=Trichinella nelsoni TaxID=6336 RepID=A0A0V0RB15_9BILA|nr:hypothetical protein T07_1995 [Trichinella nelsoni]
MKALQDVLAQRLWYYQLVTCFVLCVRHSSAEQDASGIFLEVSL